MESPRKNNDCYFYYYSTCTKGDTCTFRHEPSALGCETVCSFWKEGKCINVHCSFRHMELRKNRKAIPCYWETQPGGCLKPHCPFLHKNNKNGECESLGIPGLDSTALSTAISQAASQGIDLDRSPNQYNETKYGNSTVVDPLVVKFEEESDNESVPTNSPAKSIQTRVVKVKTLEEIRLEKIQAESAAYYSYPGAEVMMPQTPTIAYSVDNAEDLRQRIINRLSGKSEKMPISIFGSLNRPQGRKRRLKSMESDTDSVPKKDQYKTQKIVLNTKPSQDLGSIKIKTLKEIREERLKKLKQESILNINVNTEDAKQSDGDPCPEVSSTSTEDVVEGPGVAEVTKSIKKPTQRLKRKASSGINEGSPAKHTPDHNVLEVSQQQPSINNEVKPVQEESNNKTEIDINNGDQYIISRQSEPNISDNESQDNLNKLDDILLLNDDDVVDSGITFKAEDDILKDLDDLLNN